MPTIKNILIFIAIAGIVISVYIFYFKPTSSGSGNLVSSGGQSATTSGVQTNATASNVVAADFINLLLSVKGIALDDAIFSDPAFLSLDGSHSVTLIPDGKEGRPNPFAPIGVDIGAVKTSQVQDGLEEVTATTNTGAISQTGASAGVGTLP